MRLTRGEKYRPTFELEAPRPGFARRGQPRSTLAGLECSSPPRGGTMIPAPKHSMSWELLMTSPQTSTLGNNGSGSEALWNKKPWIEVPRIEKSGHQES